MNRRPPVTVGRLLRMRRLPFLALVLFGCVHRQGGAEYDDERREDRHPIDHFTTKAVFRTTFFVPTSPDDAPWPAPGATVELAEVSCSVSETKTGRTAHCVPGFSLEKKFAALLRDDDPPLGKSMKDRLHECYDVHAKTWTPAALSTYETALRQSPLALPPAAGDGWVIAYVAHDAAPFVGKCKPEPDGTCLYAVMPNQPEATVEERVARRGKEIKAVPFTPETRRLSLTFFDGHVPFELARVPLDPKMNSGDRDLELDPTKVAWDPIIAWYVAHEPTAGNLGVALVLAGRMADARGLGGPIDGVDRDDYLAKDPCAKGPR